MVEKWGRVAADLEGGQEWYWEEWVNDLDGREILQDLVDSVTQARHALPEIEAADARFRRAAIETADCAWDEEIARENGWTPEKNWWYLTQPPTAYL